MKISQKVFFQGGGLLFDSHYCVHAGLVLNGQQLFQMAAEGDARIKMEGDVQLEIKPNLRLVQIL